MVKILEFDHTPTQTKNGTIKHLRLRSSATLIVLINQHSTTFNAFASMVTCSKKTLANKNHDLRASVAMTIFSDLVKCSVFYDFSGIK